MRGIKEKNQFLSNKFREFEFGLIQRFKLATGILELHLILELKKPSTPLMRMEQCSKKALKFNTQGI